MRGNLEKLAALQLVDLRIQKMEKEKEEIPQRLAFLDEEFKKEENAVIAQRAELERLQKERRHKEKELEEEMAHIKKTEARIFEIKTNKEYQAVMKEIENAKKLNRQREEEILALLEQIEELQKNLQQAEKKLEIRRKEYQRQVAELRQKIASFDQEMAEELRNRQDKEKEIPPDLLQKYHRILERRQGLAIVRVQNGVCQACYMNIRPQLFIELQKQESLIVCPNCSRILFWENGRDKGSEPNL